MAIFGRLSSNLWSFSEICGHCLKNQKLMALNDADVMTNILGRRQSFYHLEKLSHFCWFGILRLKLQKGKQKRYRYSRYKLHWNWSFFYSRFLFYSRRFLFKKTLCFWCINMWNMDCFNYLGGQNNWYWTQLV